MVAAFFFILAMLKENEEKLKERNRTMSAQGCAHLMLFKAPHSAVDVNMRAALISLVVA